MAVSTPPTVRPHRPVGPVAPASDAGRAMVSAVRDSGSDRPPAGRRRRRAGWMLALSFIVLLVGVFAVSAWASPAASPQPPSTTAPPLPLPTADSCTPDSLVPVCQLSTATTTPQPTAPSPGPTGTQIPTSCDPSQIDCTPSTPTTTAPASPTSCSGADCIPQPTTAPPSGGQQPGSSGGDSGSDDCGITDLGACISDAINNAFASIVNAALSPILNLIGQTALSTPTLSDLPGISDLWNNSWQLVMACYGFFVLAAGILLMAHESVQARYSVKEIGPRIPIAFIASALSLFCIDKFISLANALTLAVLGGNLAPSSLGSTLQDAVNNLASGGLFMILVGLALVVLGLLLLIVYVVRIVIMLVLIISGPLFLMCHALPHTDALARWWWKAVIATLGVQVAQALVLVTAVRVMLNGAVHLFGSTLSALGTLVVAIALFGILFKIPFWMLKAVKVGSGRSFLGSLARAYVAAKTFGMVAGKAGIAGKVGAGAAARTGRGRGGTGTNSGPADPPWPAQPRLAPTPAMVAKRLKAAHDAERARAARHSRLPSRAPQFLQPQPQQSTHDPAVIPPTPGQTMPGFSSAPTPDTPIAPVSRRRQRPGSAPPFQSPGGPRRRGSAPSSARPIRVASVPTQLRFQPATPPPAPARPTPPTKATAPPAAPAFRPAQPEPRLGDAYRRAHSAPPPQFRAPTPPRGGDGK